MNLPINFKANVIPGRGVGRQLGFPTLNFKEAPADLEHGVYAGYVDDLPAAFSYGPRATFGIDQALLEAHLLEFAGKWTDQKVQIKLTSFLRDTHKFESVEELKEQIAKDVKKQRIY